MFKIGQNWGKIANYPPPPNAQHKSAPQGLPHIIKKQQNNNKKSKAENEKSNIMGKLNQKLEYCEKAE